MGGYTAVITGNENSRANCAGWSYPVGVITVIKSRQNNKVCGNDMILNKCPKSNSN
jgi:hypothetical protein